ncbi:hypothetical protein BHM03_00038818 [Ensete ventricosum]|nr:hypothetical protein BHM03_00038818 [Ensete ventricosum]
MAADPKPGASSTGPDGSKPASKVTKKKDEKKEEDLSDEDLALKQQLELYVERVQDADQGVQKLALESMRFFTCFVLYFHYLNLAGEISQEFAKRQSACSSYLVANYFSLLTQYDDMPLDTLMELVQQIVAFHMKLYIYISFTLQVEDLDLLVEHVDATNYKRACLYLTSSSSASRTVMELYQRGEKMSYVLHITGVIGRIAGPWLGPLRTGTLVMGKREQRRTWRRLKEWRNRPQRSKCLPCKSCSYLPSPDDLLALDIAFTIYTKFEDYASALRIALFLDNTQLCSLQGLVLELDEDIAPDDDDREALQEIVNNVKLSEGYLALARDIEVMEPKSPEDIYKVLVHLIDGRASASSSLDSARQNLAATFVNAFVNAGFGQGMILLWDVDSGLSQIDKYLHSNDNHVVAGALLGVGIVNCGVKNDCDPALALLIDYINKDDTIMRIGAILGLGIAYAGSQKDEVEIQELFEFSFSYVLLEFLSNRIVLRLLQRFQKHLTTKSGNMLMSLYCLWHMLEPGMFSRCLFVQKLLGYCAQHLEKGENYQGPAVLGIALIAMAEELGLDMAIRSLEHLLQYGEQNIRRAVPLALGILCISNPKVHLSLLSWNTVPDIYIQYFAAIISLGLIGAGTNNARIAGMLRNLSSYYYKEAGHLFCVGYCRPKTITGFQTHSTPVLLAAGDRAELATDKYDLI